MIITFFFNEADITLKEAKECEEDVLDKYLHNMLCRYIETRC